MLFNNHKNGYFTGIINFCVVKTKQKTVLSIDMKLEKGRGKILNSINLTLYSKIKIHCSILIFVNKQ